jgi:hypothetical protein
VRERRTGVAATIDSASDHSALRAELSFNRVEGFCPIASWRKNQHRSLTWNVVRLIGQG